MKNVLKTLENDLLTYTKAKKKSIEAYKIHLITYTLHKKHLENLNPLIKEFKTAIKIIKSNKKLWP